MPLGNSANTTPSELNSQVGSMAVQLRDLMDRVGDFASWFDKLALADVEAAFGLDAADAASMQNMINYMSEIAGVYHGKVQAGGTGGTGAVLFDFDDALAVLWGGA